MKSNFTKITKSLTNKTLSTNMHWNGILYLFLLIAITATSCKKEPDDDDQNIPVDVPQSTAIYVLNQGSYSGNNASVTLFNLENQHVTTDYFKLQNDRELGDTGADLYIYGSKAYIVTNISSQLEIVDALTFKSIKQMSFIKDAMPQQPSAITGFGKNIFVAAYDGSVTVIDTTSLEIIKVINVGLNPDALLSANGMVWVSNSGGLNFPNYDNTVSVIDPETLTEVKKIEVGTNPYTLQADAYGDIYVITRGNYGDVKMRLKIIDATTQTVKHTFEEFEAYNLAIKGDTAYVYHYDYMGSSGSSIMMLNVKTEEIIRTNFITDGTTIEAVYAIAADPNSDDVYISDAKDFMSPGTVYCFSTEGKLKSSFPAGVNPFAIRFLVR